MFTYINIKCKILSEIIIIIYILITCHISSSSSSSLSCNNVSSSCIECAPGQFKKYNPINDKIICYPCNSGEYFNNDTGKCTDCPYGFSCTKGSSSPQPCGVGFYAPKKSSICHVCELGKYQLNDKQASCCKYILYLL